MNALAKLSAVALFMTTAMLGGCATGPDGAQPPSPLEVQLLARAAMSTLIVTENVPMDKLIVIKDVLTTANSGLMIALKEDPSNLLGVQNDLLGKHREALGPYYDIIDVVLTIAIIRMRPAIDQGQTELAAQYLDAVFTGSIQSIDSAMKRLEI